MSEDLPVRVDPESPWGELEQWMVAHGDRYWWELTWDPAFPGPQGYGVRMMRGTKGHAYQVAGAFAATPDLAVHRLLGFLDEIIS